MSGNDQLQQDVWVRTCPWPWPSSPACPTSSSWGSGRSARSNVFVYFCRRRSYKYKIRKDSRRILLCFGRNNDNLWGPVAGPKKGPIWAHGYSKEAPVLQLFTHMLHLQIEAPVTELRAFYWKYRKLQFLSYLMLITTNDHILITKYDDVVDDAVKINKHICKQPSPSSDTDRHSFGSSLATVQLHEDDGHGPCVFRDVVKQTYYNKLYILLLKTHSDDQSFFPEDVLLFYIWEYLQHLEWLWEAKWNFSSQFPISWYVTIRSNGVISFCTSQTLAYLESKMPPSLSNSWWAIISTGRRCGSPHLCVQVLHHC